MKAIPTCSMALKKSYMFSLAELALFLLNQVDDALDTKLDRKFQLVTDKGTLDAIGLHPDGPVKR